MVAGTGEAPSGIIAYEHDAFPDEYLGNLLVTSWGDHRIDRFRLQPKGASFESVAEPLIVGGENFRPVGLALGPDGSLYCTDWVLRDYNLHGRGRVWRIAAVGSAAEQSPNVVEVLGDDRIGTLRHHAASESLPVRRAAARRLVAVQPNAAVSICRDENASERARYECLMALAQLGEGDHHRVLKSYVPDRDGPYDSVQTGMASHFGESPSLTALQRIMEEGGTTDPLYLLAALQNVTPVLRVFGSSQSSATVGVLNDLVAQGDPFLISELVRLMGETIPPDQLANILASDAGLSAELRAAALLAARSERPDNAAAIEIALRRPDSIVRRLAVQWSAEEHMTDLRPQVEAVLTGEPMTTDLFLATIAALDMLDGRSPRDFEQAPIGKYVVPLLTNENTPDAVKVQALRLVEADDPQLTIEVWKRLLASEDFNTRLETVRSLCESPVEGALDLLIEVAMRERPIQDHRNVPDEEERILIEADIQHEFLLRESLLGLARTVNGSSNDRRAAAVLIDLLKSRPDLEAEVIRSLRTVAQSDEMVQNAILERVIFTTNNSERENEFAEQARLALPIDHPQSAQFRGRWSRRPQSIEEWRALFSKVEPATGLFRSGPDPVASGRRVFYHPNGPGCYKCHTVEGRGGRVGPDLSYIGRSFTREKLIDSILEPSREVSPQFTTWNMLTRDGVVHTGMIVHENEGRTILGDSEGRTTELATIDIEERAPQRVSVMPEKLWERMTVQEFRDLLAYLQSLGRPPEGNADHADARD
jgi:putative heme-binding domain-containing protein